MASETEVISGDMQSSSSADEGSEQATGIRMVSIESSDDYQTPPDHHILSQNSTESGGVQDAHMMVVDDTYDRNEKPTVDITKDSDNLEFSEKSPKIQQNNTPMVEKKAQSGAAEALAMIMEAASKAFVEMPVREEMNNNDSNDLDPKGKRKLPASVSETENKNEVFMNTINRALKLLKEEGNAGVGEESDEDDEDFLGAAMRRGMTFPRPRWWPKEGESEDEA